MHDWGKTGLTCFPPGISWRSCLIQALVSFLNDNVLNFDLTPIRVALEVASYVAYRLIRLKIYVLKYAAVCPVSDVTVVGLVCSGRLSTTIQSGGASALTIKRRGVVTYACTCVVVRRRPVYPGCTLTVYTVLAGAVSVALRMCLDATVGQ